MLPPPEAEIRRLKMNLSNVNSPTPQRQGGSPYKLTEEQEKVYGWLKGQGLNVDDDTLNYWTRKYHAQRLIDVVKFAHARQAGGQQIRNIGGWIQKLLRDGAAVVNDDCQDNSKFARQYAAAHHWQSLHIFEKYVKDKTTNDDLSLTMSKEEFRRALEAMHRRVLLYSD